MAITILQSPMPLQPVYNPIILALDSTQKAQTNFQYIVEVIINGTTASTMNINSNPDGYGVADFHQHVSPYLSSSISTTSLATFRRVEDSFTEYSLKLYEQYDVSGITTTFSAATYTATTYAYNGVIPTLDFRNYDYTDYVMSSGSTGEWLTSIPDNELTMETNGVGIVNYYNASTNTTNFLEIRTSNGGVYRITNTLHPTSSSNLILGVAIGPWSIANTTSTVTMMSGTYPIIQDSTDYYDCRLLDVSGNPTSQTIRVNIDRRCSKFEDYQLIYMDTQGSYLPFYFNLSSKKTISADKKDFYQQAGSFNPNTLQWGYESYDRGRRIIDVQKKTTYALTSNWVTQEDGDRIEELIYSPDVYRLLAGTITYTSGTPIGITTLFNDGGLLQIESAGHGYVVGDLVRFNNTIPAYQNVYAYVTKVTSSSVFTVNYPYSSASLTGTDEVIKQTVTVTSGNLIGVNVNTNSTEIFKRVNKKNFNYNIVIENSLRDNSQK
jgi:hypothetical protein